MNIISIMMCISFAYETWTGQPLMTFIVLTFTCTSIYCVYMPPLIGVTLYLQETCYLFYHFLFSVSTTRNSRNVYTNFNRTSPNFPYLSSTTTATFPPEPPPYSQEDPNIRCLSPPPEYKETP